MTNILFSARDSLWPQYKPVLERCFSERGLSVTLTNETTTPGNVDYIIYAPASDDDDLSGFTNVKLIQSLWAGPDKLLKNPTLTQPLARMVDPGMTQGMIDYVMGHILYHHLHTQDFASAPKGEWRWDWGPPLSSDRVVGFLGIGELGAACATAAHDFGFEVMGWSRTPKTGLPFDCYDGVEGFAHVLCFADILVTLLPRTPATEHIIDGEAIAQMKYGVAIVNPGRGELIDDNALLAALDAGHVRAATLDVFAEEPLPASHPYWDHPRVLITPHVASETRIPTACAVVADNIARVERGEAPHYLVDRGHHY